MERPEQNEYADYYHQYVSRVPEGDIVEILTKQRDEMLSMLSDLSPEKAVHRYEPEKWSVKEVIGHIIDTERVFTMRALAFARGDKTHLPAFEQDDYAAEANYHDRDLSDIDQEFYYVRNGTIAMFLSFDDDYWQRTGVASDFEFTTRAVAYIMAGHVIHHVAVLRERYL